MLGRNMKEVLVFFSTDKLTLGTICLVLLKALTSLTSFKSAIKKINLSSFLKGNSFK